MKNFEKYKETKDALEAYNILDCKKVPFDVWLECEQSTSSVRDARQTLSKTS